MPEIAIIFSGIIVLTIILGITINSVTKKVLDYKRSTRTPGQAPAEVSALLDRTTMIEDRLKVLERIATDPEARRGADLAQEIEQLRIEQLQKELS